MNNGPAQSNFQFQPMRHELNMIQQNHKQPNVQNNWTNEFQTNSPSPIQRNTPLTKTGSPVNAQWATEFQQPMDQTFQQSNQQQFNNMPNMRMGDIVL